MNRIFTWLFFVCTTNSFGQVLSGTIGVSCHAGGSYIRSTELTYHKTGLSEPAPTVNVAVLMANRLNKQLILQSELGWGTDGYRFRIHRYFDKAYITAKSSSGYLFSNLLLGYPLLHSRHSERCLLYILQGFGTTWVYTSKWIYDDTVTPGLNNFKPFRFSIISCAKLSLKLRPGNTLDINLKYSRNISDVNRTRTRSKYIHLETGLGFNWAF